MTNKKKDTTGLNSVQKIAMLRLEFEKENPDKYKEKCCIVDDENGEPYCVWDEGKPYDCSIAAEGIKKSECEYWVTKTRYKNYSAKDVWDWLENKGGCETVAGQQDWAELIKCRLAEFKKSINLAEQCDDKNSIAYFMAASDELEWLLKNIKNWDGKSCCV